MWQKSTIDIILAGTKLSLEASDDCDVGDYYGPYVRDIRFFFFFVVYPRRDRVTTKTNGCADKSVDGKYTLSVFARVRSVSSVAAILDLFFFVWAACKLLKRNTGGKSKCLNSVPCRGVDSKI